jgi:Protein of unknown function (DUF1688)
LSAAAVRERCAIVFAAAQHAETRHFRLAPDRLDEGVRRVVDITRRRYPNLDVPGHSRWRHFAAGGVDRGAAVASDADTAERARACIDLAFVSVLVDAGAGGDWRFHEIETGLTLARSEGLAVASLRAMQAGLFSLDAATPWRADAKALARIDAERLGRAFRHGAGNPLAGLDGRARLLRRLGEACAANPAMFGTPARPGHLYDFWRRGGDTRRAGQILETLLWALGPIWPRRIRHGGVPPGDYGHHPAVPGDGLVPFHKLSQWLAYSLVEPLEGGGMRIVALDELTGLAEYRNGGLFLDCGAIEPRDPDLLRRPLEALSEPVVEWRALTVILLDLLAERVRDRLGRTASDFPLAKVLEGGSWAAGREIAFERRADGAAPLTLTTDGTLF